MTFDGTLLDNREADCFGLPYKKLPEKRFGINWFPNLERNETEEEIIKNIDEQ